MKNECPEAIIGYSGHDNGILAAVMAYMLGATVVEKHFTLNRAWKGTDHKFSLEPEGLRKQIRDLQRIDIALGNGEKTVFDFELEARKKMGKGIYTTRSMSSGETITQDDICLKTPANGTPPYLINDIIGKKASELLSEEDVVYYTDLYSQVVSTKKTVTYEQYVHIYDRSLEVTAFPLMSDLFILNFVDVSARKKAEENLEKSEKEKRAVPDSMSELVIHQDLQHRILWVNKKAADSINMKAEQVKDRYCYEIWAGSANPCTACPLEETIKTGQSQQGEMTTPDGRVWFINAYPLRDVDGNVTSVVEVVTNITEQKKAEAALRESEEKYRSLFESTHEGIVISGPKGEIVRVNSAFAAMLGYDSPEELVGIPAVELYVDPKARKAVFKKLREEGYVKNYELLFKKKDDSPIYVVITALIRRDEEGNILQTEAFVRNITERKKAEDELRESEEKYRNLIENSRDAIAIVDFKGNVLFANKSAEELTGYTLEEGKGMNVRQITPKRLWPMSAAMLLRARMGKQVPYFE